MKSAVSTKHLLRDIDVKKIDNIRSLKQQILDQFGSEFVDEDLNFNVGYHKGTTRIWIRTESDLTELRVIQSKSPTLWCDGVDQQKRKKKSKLPASEGSSDSDNDQHSQIAKKKAKNS